MRFSYQFILLILLTYSLHATETRVELGRAQNLGSALNTGAFEFGLDVTADGNTIYFNRCTPRCDLYKATRSSHRADWGVATPINELNTAATEVGPSVTADGLEIYFSDEIPPPATQNRFRPGSNSGDIWFATRDSIDSEWGAPERVPNINTSHVDTYPTISPDGLELYFSIDDGTAPHGNAYKATRSSRDDIFGDPEVLPAPINSPGGVGGIELSADGLTMFFISYRDGGFGATDLWMAQRTSTGANWQNPVNLGATVNNERLNGFPNLSPDARTLYYASQSDGGFGGLDVWSAPIAFSGRFADLNHDGQIDARDIDVMSAELLAGTEPFDLDLNRDNSINSDDRSELIEKVLNTYIGDSNLDGEFNSGDFVSVFSANEYEDGIAGNSTWATGDWNGDGEFDSGDFVTAFATGGYEAGLRTFAVPESYSMLGLWCLLLPNFCRAQRI